MRVRLVEAELVEAGAARMLTGFVADDGDAWFPDEDMAGGDWQPVRTQAANNIAANHFFISLGEVKRLCGVAFETRAVVRFKPVERAARLRVTGTYQPDSGGTALDTTFTGNPNGTWTIFFADMAFAEWR